MSDAYFDSDDEELDSAFLKAVDAIEREAASQPSANPTKPASAQRKLVHEAAPQRPQAKTTASKLKPAARADASFNDSFFNSLEIDDFELARLDQFVEDAYAGKAQPVAGPSKLTRQTTLDGTILPEVQPKAHATARAPTSKSKYTSTQAHPLFGHNMARQRTKTWDHTAFSETGWMYTKTSKDGKKGKGKERAAQDEEEDFDDEEEFEQFPDLPAPENSRYPLQLTRGEYLTVSLVGYEPYYSPLILG